MANITPLFFVETLADLEKEVAAGRTPEQVVGNIASKTPVLQSVLSIPHQEMCGANLDGHEIEILGRPYIRGQWVSTGDQIGMRMDQPPEMQAFERWTRGEFLSVEREFARLWRRSLSRLDPARYRRMFRGLAVREQKVKTLDDAMDSATRLVDGDGSRYALLKIAMEEFMPERFWTEIVKRWKSAGGPRLVDFAPYCAYVLRVNFFFFLAVQASLESADRPTHTVDLAYVYYLPFCSVFVSGDKFHSRIVRRFLRPNQLFVAAKELKQDLARLDEFYSTLPDHVQDRGIFSFVSDPPMEGGFFTAALWDRFHPGWREQRRRAEAKRNGERDDKLMELLDRIDRAPEVAPPTPDELKDPRFMHLTRQVPMRRGKWRQFPPEVKPDA